MGGLVLVILALVLSVCRESGRWYDTTEQRRAKHEPGVPGCLLKGSSVCCCCLLVFLWVADIFKGIFLPESTKS